MNGNACACATNMTWSACLPVPLRLDLLRHRRPRPPSAYFHPSCVMQNRPSREMTAFRAIISTILRQLHKDGTAVTLEITSKGNGTPGCQIGNASGDSDGAVRHKYK